jgi:hypothetical protein
MDPVEQEPPPQLLINRDTWHYRYFIFIRHYWGMTKAPTRTSLCPYCQTMFWFSFAALIFSPFFILGWTLLKIGRVIYKVLDWTGFERFIDTIDKTPMGKWLDASDSFVNDAPGPTALVTVAVTSVAIGVPGALIFYACLAIWWGYRHLSDLPGAVLSLMTALGCACFYIFYAIGYLVHWIWHAIVWFFNLLVWFFTFAPFWSGVLYWGAMILGIGLISLIVCYTVYMISQTRFGLAIWHYIIFRLNGYGEARKRAKVRQEAVKAIEEAKPWVPKKPGFISRFLSSLKEMILGKTGEFGEATGKRAGQMLTTIGILWEWIKGMKRNACPIIEFVEESPMNKGGVEEEKKKPENT